MNKDEVLQNFEEGVILQATGKVQKEESFIPKKVPVEWYVYKIGEVFVAVNDVNDAEALGSEAKLDLILDNKDYDFSLMQPGNTPYDIEDFEEILERNTCSCEEPVAFVPMNSLVTCAKCEKPLKKPKYRK